jgi:hypothetical protein
VEDFKVGDEVEFEVIFDGISWKPRWDFTYDRINQHNSSCGRPQLQKAIVKRVYLDTNNFMVCWPDHSNRYYVVTSWSWPQPGGEDCKYGSPEYLKHVGIESLDKSVNYKCECTCPIQELWNFGCTCGATKKGEKQ